MTQKEKILQRRYGYNREIISDDGGETPTEYKKGPVILISKVILALGMMKG